MTSAHNWPIKHQYSCDIHVTPLSNIIIIRPSVLNKCFMNQIVADKSEALLH